MATPKRNHHWRPRLTALGWEGLFLLISFMLCVRPWFLVWGATPEEIHRTLPGDEIIPHAGSQQTRAITIHAPAEKVWAWVAQTGQDRGGFFSFDLLENVVGCEMPTVDQLQPNKQVWQLGDKLWMYPPDKAGGVGFATLRAYIPGHVLGFATRMTGTPLTTPEDGSWTFIVEPIDSTTTRLLIRGRGTEDRSVLALAFDRTIFEPLHFMMERRMLIGLKQLSETGQRDRLTNHILVALFTFSFFLVLASTLMVLFQRYWFRACGGFLSAGVVFQILTLGQPPVLLGALLLVGVGALLWWKVSGEVDMAQEA